MSNDIDNACDQLLASERIYCVLANEVEKGVCSNGIVLGTERDRFDFSNQPKIKATLLRHLPRKDADTAYNALKSFCYKTHVMGEKSMADLHFEIGVNFLSLHDGDSSYIVGESVAQFTATTLLRSKLKDYYYRALAMYQLGLYQEAIVDCKKALSIKVDIDSENDLGPNPDCFCYELMAKALLGLKKYQEATEVLKKVIWLNNDKFLFGSQLLLGVAFYKTGQLSDAACQFAKHINGYEDIEKESGDGFADYSIESFYKPIENFDIAIKDFTVTWIDKYRFDDRAQTWFALRHYFEIADKEPNMVLKCPPISTEAKDAYKRIMQRLSNKGSKKK